jgi:hypothetical protein
MARHLLEFCELRRDFVAQLFALLQPVPCYRDDNHRFAFRYCAQPTCELITVRAGQTDVEENDIRYLRARCLQPVSG